MKMLAVRESATSLLCFFSPSKQYNNQNHFKKFSSYNIIVVLGQKLSKKEAYTDMLYGHRTKISTPLEERYLTLKEPGFLDPSHSQGGGDPNISVTE